MKSSAGGNVDDTSSVASSPGEVIQTAAEKAREKRLRDDPMADVLGPLFVSCKRCGNRIKLSPKSTYDPFHWQKHRERCLKKPAGAARKRREAHDAYHPTSKKPSTAAVGSATPPLTTDDDDELGGNDRIKEEPPSPEWDEPAISTNLLAAARMPDLAFEDYLFRSRRKVKRDITPPGPGGWHSWSWSQLTTPVWVVASYPDYAHEKDEHTSAGVNQGQPRDATNTTLSPLRDITS